MADVGRAGNNTVSFDDVDVYDEGGPSPKAVNPQGKIATTWSVLRGTFHLGQKFTKRYPYTFSQKIGEW